MLSFDVLYNRLGASLLPYLEQVEYVDTVGRDPSTLAVTLCNADGRFTREWSCTKGDSLSLRFGTATPDPFAISEVSVEAVPRLVTWRASARPATVKAPSKRGGGTPPPSSGALISDKRSWDSYTSTVTLREVAQRVCTECGLTLHYSAKANPRLLRVVRFRESGYHLLERLCRMHGLSVRATAARVQIVARPGTPDAPAQNVVDVPSDAVISMQNTEALKVSRIQSARRDPYTNRVERVSYGDGDGGVVSLGYSIADAASIYDEAILDALAGGLTVYPDARYVAGAVLKIPGLGLRVVTEMRYTRTGDSEQMTLSTRGA
jgi:hypothetical protein